MDERVQVAGSTDASYGFASSSKIKALELDEDIMMKWLLIDPLSTFPRAGPRRERFDEDHLCSTPHGV